MIDFLIQRIATMPRLPGLAIFLICFASLSTAYFVEYVIGIEPCILCLYQRIPYAAAGLFALFAIIGKPGGFTQQAALLGCAIAFSVGMGLAIYHFGVEEKFWAASCSATIDMNMSIQDLKAALMAEPMKPCDKKDWVMFGLSITVYNAFFSLIFAGMSLISFYIIRKLKQNT